MGGGGGGGGAVPCAFATPLPAHPPGPAACPGVALAVAASPTHPPPTHTTRTPHHTCTPCQAPCPPAPAPPPSMMPKYVRHAEANPETLLNPLLRRAPRQALARPQGAGPAARRSGGFLSACLRLCLAQLWLHPARAHPPHHATPPATATHQPLTRPGAPPRLLHPLRPPSRARAQVRFVVMNNVFRTDTGPSPQVRPQGLHLRPHRGPPPQLRGWVGWGGAGMKRGGGWRGVGQRGGQRQRGGRRPLLAPCCFGRMP